MAAFDAGDGQLSEGVAVDKTGNVFVSLPPLGQPLKFASGSSTYEIFESIPDWTGQRARFLGLAADARGNEYGAAQSADSTGMWKLYRKAGAETPIPGTAKITFLNSLGFDKGGNLYVTDSL